MNLNTRGLTGCGLGRSRRFSLSGIVWALVALFGLSLSGCAVNPYPYGGSPAPAAVQAASDSETSLFSGDAALLSDADIRRILEFQYRLPTPSRLAVLPLGQERWFGFSDELARSGEDLRRELVEQLGRASGVTRVAFLPAILVPRHRSVASFREAAARYQSELLLIYQASCQTYEKSRLFQASVSKAFCTVEAVLLDVKTGIVPFTTSATDELQITQQDGDANFYETRRRAELKAVANALQRIGDEVVVYFSKPPGR